MKRKAPLSHGWKYTFIIIGTAALLCSMANFYYKQYMIAGITALVAAIQAQNYRRWKKNQL